MPGIDSYTTLLLHCNGTDASTTFTDSELTPKTVTTNGNAQIDTAQSKFGGASGLFDGTGDFLSVEDSADWNMGTGDFTVDFWVRRNGDQADYAGLIRFTSNALTGWGLCFGYAGGGTTNKIVFESKASGTWAQDITSSITIANLTQTHVAVVRYGNTVTLYFDGTSVGTKNVTNYTYNSSATGAVIGRNQTNSDNYYFNGWIDEIRVSKGIARWTADFTSPTEEYDILRQTLTETISLGDSYTKSPKKLAVETITLADVKTLLTDKKLADTITLSDTLSASILRFLALYDTITLSDSKTLSVNKKIVDGITLSDAISTLANYYRTLTDSITPSDSISKLAAKSFSETITLSDLLSVFAQYAILLVESITLSESITKKDVAKKISDAVTLSDVASLALAYLRLLQDTITLSDSLSKETAKKIADRVLMTLWFIFQSAASSATSTAWTIESEDSETWTVEEEEQAILG